MKFVFQCPNRGKEMQLAFKRCWDVLLWPSFKKKCCFEKLLFSLKCMLIKRINLSSLTDENNLKARCIENET